MSGIGDIFYVLDREWRVALANEMSEPYFRRPLAEVLGMSIWDIFPDFEKSPTPALLRRAMDEGFAGSMIRPSRFQPGHFHECRVAPLGDEGITVCVVDVTERMLAEAELRESRDRLDLAVGAHALGIFDSDVVTGRTKWSAELEAIFGLPPDGFGGRKEDFERRVIAEDLARLHAATDAALAAGRDLVDCEFRIIREDGAIRWVDASARLMFDANGELVRIVGINVDVTDRKAAEEHQRLLINELNHRVKNTLAIVQAIAWQSLRAGAFDPAAQATFEGRLMALAAAHDVLTDANWESGSIARIVARAMAPHDPGGGRVAAKGPTVNLDPKAAVALALAMHELATNAVKYGALSASEGRVDIGWTLKDKVLELRWRETGGPAVSEPVQRGFGARLLTKGLAEELGGEVRLDFDPGGVVCSIAARLG
ncbi:HWE histidine kinase domain-containing protein [Phenylobacterium sp.]|uniref:sensor histidine kinase n=1 Tax=Phenylobacterium sp. TaxID=1871053 RepID=UPI0025EB93E0|nr:HWE histidine kinase domain-containing protein [Phenylobacterium sp.]